MKLTKKKTLLLGSILLAVGLLLILSILLFIGFDFTALNGEKLTLESVTVEDSFHSIRIDADWINVTVAPQNEGAATCVVTPKGLNLHTEIAVRDGVLVIEVKDVRPWHERILFFAPEELSTITLYLPRAAYQSLHIDTNTGDVCVDSGTPDALFFGKTEVETSTGDVFYHADMPADTPFLVADTLGVVDLITSTGDVTVCNTDVYVLLIYTSTGDVALTNSSARSCHMTTSTGDLCLQGLQGDAESTTLTLFAETSTGDVTIADTALTGGEITTSTGDVTVSGGSTHTLSLITSTGDVEILQYTADFMHVETSTGDVLCDGISSKRFDIRTSTGDVECPPSAKKGDYCEIETSSGDICIINTPVD